MELVFADGKLDGVGEDEIGKFRIQGHYSDTLCEAAWIKTYIDRHVVVYKGVRKGLEISGYWRLPDWATTGGEFAISLLGGRDEV